jgi:hypothetical protein
MIAALLCWGGLALLVGCTLDDLAALYRGKH